MSFRAARKTEFFNRIGRFETVARKKAERLLSARAAVRIWRYRGNIFDRLVHLASEPVELSAVFWLPLPQSSRSQYPRVLMRIFIITLIVSASLGCSGSDQYCERLIEAAGSPDAQTIMRNWVSQNINDRQYTGDQSRIHGAGGKWPGHAWLEANLDWSVLNLNHENGSRDVRLVSFPDDVSSVFFSERSRFGILVRTPGSENFGIDDKYIQWQDNDIAVICRDGD